MVGDDDASLFFLKVLLSAEDPFDAYEGGNGVATNGGDTTE